MKKIDFEIIGGIIGLIISLGTTTLIIIALLKYILS